ncbi:MAG: hypothetical protein H0X12_01425 [Nocardioides sp.]|nr:hypothetical protein [Nocardioides sp.]
MSEHANEPVEAASPATGDPAVDSVLASLSGLDVAPVGEHVPVFEAAHEQLRRALDARPES